MKTLSFNSTRTIYKGGTSAQGAHFSSMAENLAILSRIRDLLELPRCQSCTESSNVSLSHACDAAGLRPCRETLERLKKAIAADRAENPQLWNA